jgi:CHAT domain-containing protein
MNGTNGNPITFIVPGQRNLAATRGGPAQPLSTGLGIGRIKESVRIAAHRGAGEERVTAIPGEDIVVLRIAGGPSLFLHPESARDLLLAQSGTSTRDVQDRATVAGGELIVSPQLQWRGHEAGTPVRGATRGFFGEIVLCALDVITDLFTDRAADFVAREIAEKVDAQVEPGVYKLEQNQLRSLKGSSNRLTKLPVGSNGGVSVVFVHGTFSDTSGTFGKLWAHRPELVQRLFEHYHDAVYALDHRTLQASPIKNAITLVEALPTDARLHLITHSRGGLVAEVLARVCANPRLNDAELSGFKREQGVELKALAELVREQRIRVDRVVRVACPARGTLFASKRLDAYLSIFKWTLELAGVPVLPQLVDFVAAVAKRRTDPEMLPGLAAQIPDSPLVQWLHAFGNPIPGDLRVVAGDIEGDSLSSWLKTLLSDSFYWTDNDFVVQTRSMYGGSPRADGATFVLDQSGKVSHFAYFGNDRTADAVVNAITQDSPSSFSVVGLLSWGGKSSSGVRGTAERPATKPPTEKPALLVLPGMLGSHLKINGHRIWLTSRLAGGLSRLAYDSRESADVEPDGLIGNVYEAVTAYLSESHEVIPFPYDWRRPMEEEASRLAEAVQRALAAREESGQPVRILAYSSGGLLARTMQLDKQEVWDRMLEHPGARVLMLGTPNGGCWTPMEVLSGDETFGDTLTAGAPPFKEPQVRKMMAAFPGLLQLQAALDDPELKLDDRATWQRLAEDDLKRTNEISPWHAEPLQQNEHNWGVPTQEALDKAVALRRRLNKHANQFAGLRDKLAIVVGQAKLTVAGYVQEAEGFTYAHVTDRGDGRVTFDNAILPSVPAWTAACDHTHLASYKEAFQAYRELLDKGTTNLLARVSLEQTTLSVADLKSAVRMRPSRIPIEPRPAEREEQVFTLPESRSREELQAAGTALRVSVVNGDLMFVQQPILIGHYRSMRLTGTELVMDGLVGHTMRNSLILGQYPDAPGTHQVFINARSPVNDPYTPPRPEAVIVVGLGEEGKLNAAALVQTVRLGVIAWAQRVLEKPGAPAVFDIAATLIGSGGKGISVAQSAQLVAEAVREADDRLARAGRTRQAHADQKWPRVRSLQIVELYLDRATEALSALKVIAEATPSRYVVAEGVKVQNGALPRPLDSGYRGADYDFITVVSQTDSEGRKLISYTLDTKRARTEVTAQKIQPPLIRDLVAASNTLDDTEKIGRTLFNMLVPVEIEPFLGGSTEMVLDVDDETASIPWELLDTSAGAREQARPWAIRAKVIRKLRTLQFRVNPTDATADANVLVIGEPKSPERYPPLLGARNEAWAVAERFCLPDALSVNQVVSLVRTGDAEPGPDATAVLKALHDRPWRIVHIAGHGAPPETDDASEQNSSSNKRIKNPRGVVLSNDMFLGAIEFSNMRVVPELVFVNCCHLAGRSFAPDLPPPYDRPRFAATVAEALINLGVRCVVAAGWAVDDNAAKLFATTFYDALIKGDRFIDAVAKARSAARDVGGNTWAAYQCYGDPEWIFKRNVSDAQRPRESLLRKFASVASAAHLKLALATITAESRMQAADLDSMSVKKTDPRDSIRYLDERFGKVWGDIGEVAEAFAAAWAHTGESGAALEWYKRAVAANDGTAPLRAVEQLANQRARFAWNKLSKSIQEKCGKKSCLPDFERVSIDEKELADARGAIHEAIAVLQKLADMQSSPERESLLGSAYKRLAMVETAARSPHDESRAVEQMRAHYHKALTMARENRSADLFYPALNSLVSDLVVHAGIAGWTGLDPDSIKIVRSSLAAKVHDDPDFWSVVGETELRMYEALSHGNLAENRDRIEREFNDVFERVSAIDKWSSVYDNAEFVLRKYVERTGPKEKDAALEVWVCLARMAHRSINIIRRDS